MERGYKYLILFFVLIFILIPIGFRRYFGLFPHFEHTSGILHFHVVVMIIWCTMLIVQPFLIQKSKLQIHRRIGQISYVLVPFIVLSMIGVMLNSFERMKDELTIFENRAALLFPVTQILLFSIFYVLAMVNRHNAPVHMRYIIVSSVSLLGPTIGRLNFNVLGLGGFNWDLIIMDLVLICLIALDWYNGKGLKKVYLTGLAAYLSVHALSNFNFGNTSVWQCITSALVS